MSIITAQLMHSFLKDIFNHEIMRQDVDKNAQCKWENGNIPENNLVSSKYFGTSHIANRDRQSYNSFLWPQIKVWMYMKH